MENGIPAKGDSRCLKRFLRSTEKKSNKTKVLGGIVGKYKIIPTEGDTPEIHMDGYFSMDDLENILFEAKEIYFKTLFKEDE